MKGCTCIGVAMGSYGNQETRLLPFATPRFPEPGTKRVGIDRCILPDIEALWAAGIETVESCCGHGVTGGYIIVVPESIEAMRQLGYSPDPRKPDRADLFGWPIPARCEDCGRPYGDEHGFPDLIIPLDVWRRISTAGDVSGLLCPSCICGRLSKAGIRCEGAFMSGPIETVSRATMNALRRVENVEEHLVGRAGLTSLIASAEEAARCS